MIFSQVENFDFYSCTLCDVFLLSEFSNVHLSRFTYVYYFNLIYFMKVGGIKWLRSIFLMLRFLQNIYCIKFYNIQVLKYITKSSFIVIKHSYNTTNISKCNFCISNLLIKFAFSDYWWDAFIYAIIMDKLNHHNFKKD